MARSESSVNVILLTPRTSLELPTPRSGRKLLVSRVIDFTAACASDCVSPASENPLPLTSRQIRNLAKLPSAELSTPSPLLSKLRKPCKLVRALGASPKNEISLRASTAPSSLRSNAKTPSLGLTQPIWLTVPSRAASTNARDFVGSTRSAPLRLKSTTMACSLDLGSRDALPTSTPPSSERALVERI